MNDKEINETLSKDYDKFLYQVYSGKVAVPKDIIEIFKIAIVAIPSFAHKISFTKIKNICTTPVNELTNADLNDLIKVVLNVSLEKMYPTLTFEQIIEKGIYMDKFVLCYNQVVEEFQKSLESKKKVLKDLTSGVRGNGMRIIQKGQA